MLRIYPVSIQVAREARPFVDRIARFDRAASVQLRKSLGSVVNNLAEGSGLHPVGYHEARRAGRRRLAYEIALGEAREALANLEFAEAMGYSPPVPPKLRAHFNHIIGTLVRVVHRP